MKKIIYLITVLFLTLTMQAQTDRSQPKPAPSPIVNVGKPKTFQLPNGLKIIVVENHKLPRVSINLTIDNNPFTEGDKKGVDELTGSLIGNGTNTISKNDFNEEIDFLGATIGFRSSGAYASALSKYYVKVMDLLAQGVLDPNFTQEEFDKEKAKMIEGLKADEKSVPANARRVENILAFGKKHPYGEYLSEATINNITLNDVKLQYNTYFVPQNAYLVIIGDVKFDETKALVEKNFSLWKNAKAPVVTYTTPKNVQYTQINFIDMSNAVQSEIAVVNTVTLKMNEKDYFAALLANQILGGGGEGRLFLNLREAHGWTYGSYSNINGNKFISKFRASASVRNSVTDSAVVEILNELKKIRSEKVTPEELKIAKAKYIGNFVMQMEKPQTVARYALNIETQKLPKDFYENYIKNINTVTSQQVMDAAKKYFMYDNSRIIIVGKSAEVLPNLEKLNIPIFYFDKFGNAVTKPEAKTVTTNITAKSVLENYIAAIGGEKATKEVKSLYTKSTGIAQGMPLELISKVTTSSQSNLEMNAMGMTMIKQVFNKDKGYKVEQGQKINLTEKELVEIKNAAAPFPELSLLNNKDIRISGIKIINGKKAYVLKIARRTLFFDSVSGLKIEESITKGEQTITSTFYDYQDVKGLKFPFKTVMNAGFEIEFITSEILINESITDSDFE